MITLGSYVRIGNGDKVYQVIDIATFSRPEHEGSVRQFRLAATADHPDAAIRVQNAFAWFVESELTKIRRR